MARRISKQTMLPPQTIVPTGGVNLGNAPVDLNNDELSNSLNGYYPKDSARWTVRPGIECVTDATNKLSEPILAIKPYYNGTTQYLMGVSGGKLYQMTKAVLDSSPAWTEVGSLTDATTKPSMLTYQSLLIVADGGTSVRYWDGTTYGALTNSPAGCTALAESRGRLIGNSSSALDYVYLSAPYFSDKNWESGSGQLEIAAGFGDGVPVNAFSVGPGGVDMLVSKRNAEQGVAQIRRLLMSDSDTANWYVSEPSVGNSGAQNAHGMLDAFGRTFYFDDSGIRAIDATDTYVDVQPSPHFGKRINKMFDAFSSEVMEISYLTTLGAWMILFKAHAQQYLYFPRNDAFCPWRLSGAIINSVCTIDGDIYMGSEDGNLYRMNEDLDADEIQPDESAVPIESYGRTKKFISSGRNMILKRSTLAMTPIKSGTLTARAILNDQEATATLKEFAVSDGAELLGAATYLLGEATTLLGDLGAEPTLKTVRGGPKDRGLQFEWYGRGSRYEIEHIILELAAQ